MISFKLRPSFNEATKESRVIKHLIQGGGILCAVLAVYVTFQKPVTVLVPWTAQHSGYVSQDIATESFKISNAMMLATMFGNVNFGSVDLIEQRIAPLLPNDSYQSVMTALRAQAMQFNENHITARFEIVKYVYEPATDKVFITGNYYISANNGPEKHLKRTYEFIIGMESFMPDLNASPDGNIKYTFLPQILYMNTYEDEPRTLERLKELKEKGKLND
ncbi:MAG: TraE/TraK family type IV conjugative transfer system protein [Succinatimonas hippei]|nr:TraE/TraK family type IV conjugative transfer system protein [Succinatimonas hippei]